MGKQKKKQKKCGNPLWTLVFLAALAVFCFSGYKLIGIYLDYKTGTDEYRDLQQYTTEITKTPETPAPKKTEEPLSYPTEPPLAVDFESLKAINPDVKGWLYIEALDISYPVVQGPDNDAYLHTTYEGTSNFAGSIFLDYQNQGDFSDGNTIVYGHNMKNGSMFAKLAYYKNESFYRQQGNDVFYIYTGDEIREYRIFDAFENDPEGYVYTCNFGTASQLQEYASTVKSYSLYDTGVDVSSATQVVTFSTCTGDGARRIIVQGIYVGSRTDKQTSDN